MMKKIVPPLRLLVACIAAQVAPRLLWPIAVWFPFPLNYIGVLPVAAGFTLAGMGLRRFRAAGTNIHPFVEADKLVTDGVYRFTRNPMYLGLAIVLVGSWILNRCAAGGLVVPVFILIADRWYIRGEEKMLSRKFGRQYDHYRARTRRWV
ncbi:MAG: isoprenylcysteine carboxylmethyltransferase family protein [Phycisphaerae bacterium]